MDSVCGHCSFSGCTLCIIHYYLYRKVGSYADRGHQSDDDEAYDSQPYEPDGQEEGQREHPGERRELNGPLISGSSSSPRGQWALGFIRGPFLFPLTSVI